MGVEAVDSWRMSRAKAICDSGKRLERQASSKEQQFGLRWLGRTSPDRESVASSGSGITPGFTQQSIVKQGGSVHPVYQGKTSKSSGKSAGYSSVRTKAQHQQSEIQSQSGRASTSQATANSRRGDAEVLHDHFKKEFLESLVSKAKQRTCSKFSSGSEGIIKAIEAKANEDRAILPAREQNRIASSLSLKEDRRGWKMAGNAESPVTTPQITSQDIKQRTSPTNERFRGAVQVSKGETCDHKECSEQSWHSKPREEPAKDFSSRVLETRAKATEALGSYDGELGGGANDETCPAKDSSTNQMVLYEQEISNQNGNVHVRQHLFVHHYEAHNLGQSNAGRVNSCASNLDECKMLVDQVTQVRCETTFGSPASSPSGRKLWSLESGKDSLNMLRKKLDGQRKFEDSRSKGRNGIVAGSPVHEKLTKRTGADTSFRSPESNDEAPPENENMLRSLKLAAAIDQAHFLRALQSAGAVQTSTPTGIDCDREIYPSLTMKLSPAKDVRNSKSILDENSKRKYPQQGDARECRVASATSTGPKHSGIAASVRRHPSSNGSKTTSNKCPANARGNSQSAKTGGASSLRERSHRSSTSEDSDTSSGAPNSILQMLMKKVSMRSSLTSQSDESNASFPSGPASPVSLPPPTPRSSSELEPWLRTSTVGRSLTDLKKPHLDSPPPSSPGIPSSTFSGSSSRISSWERRSAKDLSAHLQDHKISTTKCAIIGQPLKQSLTAATEITTPVSADFGNDILSDPSEVLSTDAESQSPGAASPPVCDLQKCETALDPCHTLATSERKTSAGLIGANPRSPGSDDSGSEASGGTDHSSPVSVLLFKSGRIPLQEDNRLTPLEHKLQELHERIRKSKRDVSNQKRANLEKIKTARRELMLRGSKVVDSTISIQEISLTEDLSTLAQDSVVKSPKHIMERQAEGKVAFANRSLILRDEVVQKVVPEVKQLSSSISLESFDLREVPSCTEELRWDLVYVRDLLLVSTFGQQEPKVTKWHSVTLPMNPGLFEKLEDFYKRGKKFPGSHVLSRLALSQDDHLKLRKRIRDVHLNAISEQQEGVDSMNRGLLFDVVNETLAKRLAPYIAIPRPWMTSWAKPLIRPQSTRSGLLLEVWSDISDQTGNNGSMAMDTIKLHQSLEELVRLDLNERSNLFPCRELERAAERIGLELDRRILDDLIEETIAYLSHLGDRPPEVVDR